MNEGDKVWMREEKFHQELVVQQVTDHGLAHLKFYSWSEHIKSLLNLSGWPDIKILIPPLANLELFSNIRESQIISLESFSISSNKFRSNILIMCDDECHYYNS